MNTNTVEGFNRQVRKITKSKGGFSNDESLFKLVFLIYRDIAKNGKIYFQLGRDHLAILHTF